MDMDIDGLQLNLAGSLLEQLAVLSPTAHLLGMGAKMDQMRLLVEQAYSQLDIALPATASIIILPRAVDTLGLIRIEWEHNGCEMALQGDGDDRAGLLDVDCYDQLNG